MKTTTSVTRKNVTSGAVVDQLTTSKKAAAENRAVCTPSIEGYYTQPLSDPTRVEEKEKKVGLEEVLDLVEHLDLADRKELLAKLALNAQAPQKESDRDLEMWAVAVYRAVARTIGASSEGMPAPMIFRRALAAGNSWGAVTDFMKASKLSTVNVTARQGVYVMLADLLVKHAVSSARYLSVPLSAKFIANAATNIASIFDNAFPGYAASGLAPIVAARLAAGAVRDQDE